MTCQRHTAEDTSGLYLGMLGDHQAPTHVNAAVPQAQRVGISGSRRSLVTRSDPVPLARQQGHSRARSPRRERRRRPGPARPLERSPAERQRSRPPSRPPPPGRRSIADIPVTIRWSLLLLPGAAPRSWGPGRVSRPRRARVRPRFDEAFVDHCQAAQSLLESCCLVHVPPLAVEPHSISCLSELHQADHMKNRMKERHPSSSPSSRDRATAWLRQ